MCKRSYLTLVTGLLALGMVTAQFKNVLPPSGRYEFSLDRPSDCDGTVREVGQSVVQISGKSSVQVDQNVLSCTLTLSSDNVREPMRFKLHFLQAYIEDETVQFHVYDGEYNGMLKWSFSKYKPKPSNLEFDFTTGQTVTFRLTRGKMDTRYDIRVTAEPVPTDVSQCIDQINAYGCDEYGYNYRIIGTKEIIGIVAGGFALVVFIVIIVVVCCYRKQRGISRRWKEEKLGHVNTAASIHSLNGRVTHDSNKAVWASESSKIASIRRSPNLPRARITRPADSMNSVSESSIDTLQKRPLPSTNRSTSHRSMDRRRDYRDRDRGYDKYSEESDHTFSTRDNYKPPTYREALRHDSDSDIGHATDSSFVGAGVERPGKPFIEREIAPRVKPKVHTSVQKKPPPPEEDETYDSIEPKKITKAIGPDDDEEDTEGEVSIESEEEEESSEEEEEESDDDNKMDEADKAALYSKPNKNKSKQAKAQPQSQAPPTQPQQPPQWAGPPMGLANPAHFPQGPPYPGYFPPGVHQPQPRYGYPPQQMPQQAVPGNPYMQAQFTVPMQANGVPMPAQTQPMGHPSGHYPSNNPPRRDHHPSHRRDKQPPTTVPPNQPPVYSYLVNRGYQPIDGRYSPVSTSTGASNLSRDNNLGHTDDSDFSANLDSGVELMKRTTAI